MKVATLLWVDDELDSTAATVRLLVRRGFSVDCTPSASRGLLMALSRPYDVIILDLRLPDGSGLGVLDALRFRGVSTPVALLTGYGTIATAAAAGQLGAARFLQKPLGIDSLIQTMHELIHESKANKDLQANVGGRLAHRLRMFVCFSSSRGLAVSRATLDAIERSERFALQPRSTALDAITLIEELLLQGCRPKEEDIASRLGVDRSHLGRIILSRTGLGYRDWRRLLATTLAIEILENSSDPVSQVAYRMGFEHHSRFDVEFHHTFGISPKRFRDLAQTHPLSPTLSRSSEQVRTPE